jgi:ankyrin repeat protein
LLQSGARPDIQDEEDQTPLHWAVRKNWFDIAQSLLKLSLSGSSVNLDIPDTEGRIPLLLAAEGGNSILVSFLLEDYNFKPDIQDKTGRDATAASSRRRWQGIRDDAPWKECKSKYCWQAISHTPAASCAEWPFLWRQLSHPDQKREEANLDGRDKREKANLVKYWVAVVQGLRTDYAMTPI